MEEENKSLVVKPVMELKDAQEAFRNFQSIKTDVLGENDFSTIAGKQFVNKSGWRKIKTMFGFDEEILSSSRFLEEDSTIRWIY